MSDMGGLSQGNGSTWFAKDGKLLAWVGKERVSESVCMLRGWQADAFGFEYFLRCPGLSDSSRLPQCWGMGVMLGAGP